MVDISNISLAIPSLVLPKRPPANFRSKNYSINSLKVFFEIIRTVSFECIIYECSDHIAVIFVAVV